MDNALLEQPDKKRSTSSSTTVGALLVGALLLQVTGQSCENLAAPLWFGSLESNGNSTVNGTNYADSFLMFEIMIIWYPILFFFTSIVTGVWSKRGPFAFLKRYSAAEHGTIALTGVSDALNGILVITASPSSRTPPIVASLIGNLVLFPLVFFKHFYFKVHHCKVYKSSLFGLAVILYLLAGFTLVYPEITGESQPDASYWWWLVFFIGAVLGGVYNVQQERFFRLRKYKTMDDYIGYLFWQTLYLALVGYIFIWVDLIPGFGTASTDNFADYLNYTFTQSFAWPTFGWNMMFNMGYYVAYIAACYVNAHDAFIGVLAAAAVSAVVTAISYPIPELTPDQSIVDIGLVPMTIVLSTLAIGFYAKWVMVVEPYVIDVQT